MKQTINDEKNGILTKLEENYSETHKVLRSIESDIGKKYYALLEIDMDRLDHQITELKDLIVEKKKLEEEK